MCNKSGKARPVVSLSKGGRTLQGRGEAFTLDLHAGTGNLTVPITLASGTNDFQRELNLVYRTGDSNGPFGLGWTLTIPGVSRNTSEWPSLLG